MAVVLKSSALLLLLFLAGEMPIYGVATGERCSKKVSCTSGDSCDLVFSECRIKVGQACKNTPTMCITGAMCDTGADRCKCVESKFASHGFVCKSKTAGSLLSVGCDKDKDCTNKGLKCAAGICLCREPREPQFETGTCGGNDTTLGKSQPKQTDEKTAKAGNDSATTNVKDKTTKAGNDSKTTIVKAMIIPVAETTVKAGNDSTTTNVNTLLIPVAEETAKAGSDSTTTTVKGTTAGALTLGPSVLSITIAALLSLLEFRQ